MIFKGIIMARAFNKKMLVSDGHQARFVDAHELSSLARISLKHAYRIMSEPERMTPGIRALVEVQLFGKVPGWPSGWSFKDGKVCTPSGNRVLPEVIENISLFVQLEKEYINRINELEEENRSLKVDLKKPRLVVNNLKSSDRGLRLVK